MPRTRLSSKFVGYLCICICICAPSSPTSAQDVDEQIRKIEEYTQVLEGDAAHYEKHYEKEAKTLMRWRLGWEGLIALADRIYALEVTRGALARVSDRIATLQIASLEQDSRLKAPEVDFIYEQALDDLNKIDSLISTIRGTGLDSCSDRPLKAILERVPTDSVVSINSPSIATYPLVKADPILRLNIAISENGDVTIASAPYQGEAEREDTAFAPGVASTVSYAVVLLFAKDAYTPATAVAAFVFLVTSHIESNVQEGKIADAIRKMNSAIDRILASQSNGYRAVNAARLDILRNVCRTSYSDTIDRVTEREKHLRRLALAYRRELSGIATGLRKQPRSDDWERVQCEIFGCGEGESYYTWSVADITRELIKRNSLPSD